MLSQTKKVRKRKTKSSSKKIKVKVPVRSSLRRCGTTSKNSKKKQGNCRIKKKMGDSKKGSRKRIKKKVKKTSKVRVRRRRRCDSS